MLYLVIALAVLMVIGPVLWLKPSQAQQRQTRLRLRARALGLDVRLSNLPQTRRARVRQETPRQGAAYRLPVFDKRTVVAIEHLIARESSEQAWESEQTAPLSPTLQAALDQVAAAVPKSTAAIELAPQGPAIYWREQGDEQTVEQVAALLQQLRAAMAAGTNGTA